VVVKTLKDISFETCLPNPHNPEKGMMIYTALSNEAVGKIGHSHGLDDYVLFLNDTVISRGIYNKNDKWTF